MKVQYHNYISSQRKTGLRVSVAKQVIHLLFLYGNVIRGILKNSPQTTKFMDA